MAAVGVAAVFVHTDARATDTTGGTLVTIELVALAEAGLADEVTALPTSQESYPTGSSVFLEVWAQTTDPNGLTSVSLDLQFGPALSADVIAHSSLFTELRNGSVDNPGGSIDDLSGSHLGPCEDEVGVAPKWARLAVIEMAASGAGSVVIQSSDSGSATFGTAICGVGDVDPLNVAFGAVHVTIGGTQIPTSSAWSLLLLAGLLLVAGVAVSRRRVVVPGK